MPGDQTDFWDMILKGLPAIGVALFGAFARVMTATKDPEFDVKFILGSFSAAGFVGLMVHLLLFDVSMPESMKAFLIGCSGASAQTVMGLIQGRTQKLLERFLK